MSMAQHVFAARGIDDLMEYLTLESLTEAWEQGFDGADMPSFKDVCIEFQEESSVLLTQIDALAGLAASDSFDPVQVYEGYSHVSRLSAYVGSVAGHSLVLAAEAPNELVKFRSKMTGEVMWPRGAIAMLLIRLSVLLGHTVAHLGVTLAHRWEGFAPDPFDIGEGF